MAQRGYSRDKRSDRKQVCIGLVVSKNGMPLGYEVFEGNRHDSKTWQHIITTMEERYGKADCIWCGDRGMMSKANLEFMQSDGRKYIVGASKITLKKFEQELLREDWKSIRSGLEVKMCKSPDGDQERFILCLSKERSNKENAMHQRFEQRIEDALEKLKSRIFDELGKIRLVDVILPTRKGINIRRRCVRKPTDHQAILLSRLKLRLPRQITN
jgi:transposase